MATTFNFKDKFDVPEWRPMSPSPNTTATGGAIVSDPRAGADSCPYLYQLVSATVLNRYLPRTNEWIVLASPALTGTFGAGAGAVFHPTQGPRGTITTGNTTTKVVLSTALPAAVGINQLSNRGDGTGYKIRIVGSASGSSGKTEERYIVANTSGTTPTIYLDSALSFTPASGDTYEILSGRVFLLSAGTMAAGCWKYYDIATNSYSGNLSITNFFATLTLDTALFAMSEANVPNDKSPGQGFFGSIVATGSAAGTITGTVAGVDSTVTANEYRNFQIRIVQDTAIPTAAGQRRRITSHTAGASPVYTLASNWTVTPSTTATFVVEYDDDKILCWSSATATTYTYGISGNAWDTTTFGASGGTHGAGTMAFGSWGISRDTLGVAKQSYVYVWRGGSTATVDVLDIAGGTTGTWDNAAVVGGQPPAFTTGTCGVYAGGTNGGRYAYINANASQRFMRFDVKSRTLEPWGYLPVAQSTTIAGNRMAIATFVDGAAKMDGIHVLGSSQTNLHQCWAHN